MSIYVAAYDIQDNRRRAKVAKALLAFGHRVQESVFELWLEPAELPYLRITVGPLLRRGDCFDLFPVDERGPRRRESWQRPPDAWRPVLLL